MRLGTALIQSCVILAFRNGLDSNGALKMRVLWMISALIAASARHYMTADVLMKQHSLSRLIVNDMDKEGTVIEQRWI